MKDIVETRKKEMEAKYKEFYDKNILEEKVIPTYTDHCKEWWTLKRNYKTSVGERSRVKLMQTQKFWVKPEVSLTADYNNEQRPVDPFKVEHHKQKSKSKLFDNFPIEPHKLMKLISKAKLSKACSNYKWSAVEFQHRGNAKSRFHTKDATYCTTDYKPMYSSFAKFTSKAGTQMMYSDQSDSKLLLNKRKVSINKLVFTFHRMQRTAKLQSTQ